MLTLCLAIIAMYCFCKLFDLYDQMLDSTKPEFKWWNPVLWPLFLLVIITSPFLWLLSRPKNNRTP